LASEKKLAEEKAEDQLPGPAEDGSQEPPSDAELAKADAKLPVYDEEARILKSHELRGNSEVVPDTPSGYAVKKVGNLDGEDVDHSKPGATEAARAHGEAYQAAKREKRWGY
jgi:hypothetical protein